MTTVITYGTFDLFHEGHYNILKRAKDLGDKLIVYVSTDEFNKLKGKTAHDSFDVRVINVLRTGLVDVVLPEEDWEQKRLNILSQGPNVTLVMGDDWEGKFDRHKDIATVVYLPRTPGISSTQLRDERNRK